VPAYYALVVDEAQDNDTGFLGEAPAGFTAGWWSIYFHMLRQGAASPMALFFDPGQRPLFRDRGTFDPDLLCRHLSQPARLRLAHAVRYARPILEFLKSLSSETTANLVGTLRAHGNMPEGPDVEIYGESEDKVADRVKAIVKSWTGTGYCKVEDILVLSPHAKQESTALREWIHLGSWPIVAYDKRRPGDLSLLSVNRAKGLDALGIILIDVQPFEHCEEGRARMDYFMGASRARQLLAVVHTQGK